MGQEPSMEEILSSIKKIIADEDHAPAAAAGDDDVLELTEESAVSDDRAAVRPAPRRTRSVSARTAAVPPATIVSPVAAAKSRDSLAALSALLVQPDAPDNTLEGLVRELLRPVLKEWLDARLPEIVESMVAKEIARITGRAL